MLNSGHWSELSPTMKLIKSVAFGLAAALIALWVLPFLIARMWIRFLSETKHDTYFVVWHLRSLPFAVAALVIFLAAFSWRFRRQSRTR